MKYEGYTIVDQAVTMQEFCERNLEKAKTGYICPACGNGSGHSGTGITVTGETFICYKCQAHGNKFDLAGLLIKREGEQYRQDQIDFIARQHGIAKDKPQPAQGTQKTQADKQPDYSEARAREAAYIIKCQEEFKNSEEAQAAWAALGFTLEEGLMFGIGYDREHFVQWTNEAGEKVKGARLIYPWLGNNYYHVDRACTTEKVKPKFYKPGRERVGEQPLYNAAALEAEAFFIVEGVKDALAIKACGFEAVALAGLGTAPLSEIAARGTSAVIIPFLDKEEAAQQKQLEAVSKLQSAGLPVFSRAHEVIGTWTNAKDAGDMLQENREQLTSDLARAYSLALEGKEAARTEAYKTILRNFDVKDPVDVAGELFLVENTLEAIPTGIASLDAALNGGIVPGTLNILGGTSSFGKTSFILQVADSMAASGRGVLFVSIEQSAHELVAKSLARIIAQTTPSLAGITPFEIMTKSRRETWGENYTDALLKACNTYAQEIAPNLAICEAQPTVDEIRTIAYAWANYHGSAPILFVDYLQLIAPPDERATDKQAIDRNVTALRRLARELQTPIILVSSLNRDSYSEGITQSSFKESGAIEYSSDLLLGIQPEGLTERLDDTAATKQRREALRQLRQNKQQTERACELVILKNRNGRTSITVPITFKTLTATFTEKEERFQKVI